MAKKREKEEESFLLSATFRKKRERAFMAAFLFSFSSLFCLIASLKKFAFVAMCLMKEAKVLQSEE